MTIPYGPNEEMFTFSAFLVLNNRIVVVIVALCNFFFSLFSFVLSFVLLFSLFSSLLFFSFSCFE